jgi:hypothetical protein
MRNRSPHPLSHHPLSPAVMSRTDCERPHGVDQLPATPCGVGTGLLAMVVITIMGMVRTTNTPHPTPRDVRVDDDLWNHALAVAAARGENLSGLIRRVLRSYVEDPHGVLPPTAVAPSSSERTAP